MKLGLWPSVGAAALWLGVVGVTPLAHAVSDSPRDYAALATVQTTSTEGLQRIALPLAVLQRSRSTGLADVRVFNAEGQAVPMAWSGAPAASEAATRSAAVPQFVWPQGRDANTATTSLADSTVKVQINAAGAVVRVESATTGKRHGETAPPRVWLLDVSRLARGGEQLAALQLDWPAQPAGVSLVAEVEASDDATHWLALTQSPLLETAASSEPASAAVAVTRKRIVLPTSIGGADRPKYLRLSLSAPVPLSAVNAELHTAAPPPALDSARFDFRPVPPDASAPREWVADLQGALPLQRLQLHLPQANTLGSFTLERRASEQAPWQAAAAMTAYRLVRNGREAEAPPVELPGAWGIEAARHWRLRLSPGAPDIGAGAVAAEVFWPPRQLVFAARGSAPFQLAVGRDAALPVALPLATVIPEHRSGDEFKLPAATLGAVTEQVVASRSVGEQIADASPADRRKWLLWGVLVVAVGGLAWMARRLVHEMKA